MIKKNKNVIFMHSSLGLLIKKISNVDSQKKVIYVKGNNDLSISQEMLGPIKFSQIKGFPLIHIKNKSKNYLNLEVLSLKSIQCLYSLHQKINHSKMINLIKT